VNTAVIFSFSFQTSCIEKTKKSRTPIKIGVQSDLLSFDPLSFQSLGEKKVIDLLYGRALYIKDNQIKTDFNTKVTLADHKITFKALSKNEKKLLSEVFKKGSKSTLWKSVFTDFDFRENSIYYLKKENFISNLKTLMPLLRVKGDGYGEYEVQEHQKGIKVLLAKKNNLNKNKKRASKILVKRVKTFSGGLDQVYNQDLDVFLPNESPKKNELKAYKDLDVVYSNDQTENLRLYFKYG
jgi:hypothetical protein